MSCNLLSVIVKRVSSIATVFVKISNCWTICSSVFVNCGEYVWWVVVSISYVARLFLLIPLAVVAELTKQAEALFDYKNKIMYRKFVIHIFSSYSSNTVFIRWSNICYFKTITIIKCTSCWFSAKYIDLKTPYNR
jgi:hypothetical protein